MFRSWRFIIFPFLILVIGFFLIKNEVAKSQERNQARVDTFSSIRTGGNPVSVLISHDKKIKDINSQGLNFSFNFSSANFNFDLCNQSYKNMIAFVKTNNQADFLEEIKKYEKANCLQ